jgi:hypothetical protein
MKNNTWFGRLPWFVQLVAMLPIVVLLIGLIEQLIGYFFSRNWLDADQMWKAATQNIPIVVFIMGLNLMYQHRVKQGIVSSLLLCFVAALFRANIQLGFSPLVFSVPILQVVVHFMILFTLAWILNYFLRKTQNHDLFQLN